MHLSLMTGVARCTCGVAQPASGGCRAGSGGDKGCCNGECAASQDCGQSFTVSSCQQQCSKANGFKEISSRYIWHLWMWVPQGCPYCCTACE